MYFLQLNSISLLKMAAKDMCTATAHANGNEKDQVASYANNVKARQALGSRLEGAAKLSPFYEGAKWD